MANRSTLILLTLTLLAAACNGNGAEGQINRLVVLDETGNIVTMDPDGSNRTEITDDAGARVGYAQPVWSPESDSFAWGEVRGFNFAVGTAGNAGEDITSVEVNNFPFYLYWSPDGERLGVLHNAPDGVGLHFVVVENAEGSAELVDVGAPYYFSWSPDGSELVVHVGGDRLSLIDEAGVSSEFGETSPDFLSPHWTPAGVFYLSPEGVVLQESGEEPFLVSESAGFVSLVPNPDGSRLATQVIGPTPPGQSVALEAAPSPLPNRVSVIDIESGDLDVASSEAALGYFWSPDGDKLMMLIPTSPQGDVDVSVWEAGETRVLTSIQLPVSLLRDALQFFDQYAQSWQMWAPDSSALVLPGRRQGEAGIWMLSLDGSDPVLISDGEWAAWSHS